MRFLVLWLISLFININSTYRNVIEKSVKLDLDGSIIKIVDNITKSPFDIDRSYRGLILKNGLKVILVSDSQTNFSAAALTVAIGSRNDPVEYMGMAHFVEHMLFQGSKKYPDKSEFWNFVDNHSGDKNAYTSDDRTTFYFNIASDYFAQALEMWSNFFIDPLFAESSVVNEVDAVQSEYDIYLKQDIWRVDQVYRSICDRADGFNPFTIGSKETLLQSAARRNVTLSSQAKKFFKENYSSNIMALSIVDSRSLDQLTKLAVDLFGKIANKNSTRKIWRSPYGKNFLSKQLNVAALTDQKLLHVNFPIPFDMVPFKHKLAQRYVGRFFLSSEPGTFTYKLKEENLASAVGWDCDSPGRGSSLCQLTFILTEKGLQESYTIVNRLFAYLNEIANNHLDEEWIFEENRHLMSAKFVSQDKPSVGTLTQNIVEWLMSDAELENVLVENFIVLEPFDRQFIKKFVSYLSVDNFNFDILSKSFTGKTDKTEKFFNVSYHVENIPQQWRKELSDLKVDTELNYPKTNEFVPKNIEIPSAKELANCAQDSKPPNILLEDEYRRLWHRKDEMFKQPKTRASLIFRFPFSRNIAREIALLYQFCKSYHYLTKNQLSDALIADYEIWMDATSVESGFALNFKGLTDRMALVIEKSVEILVNQAVDNATFENAKGANVDGYSSLLSSPTHSLSRYYMNAIIQTKEVLFTEIIDPLKELTLNDIENFHSRVFGKVHVEMVVYGSMDESEALSVFKSATEIVSSKKPKPLYNSELFYNRFAELEPGEEFVYEQTLPIQVQTGAMVIYEIPVDDVSTTVKNELLSTILSGPCFSILRTEEQLGYAASCGSLRSANNVNFFYILVSGPYNPIFVQSRIENFVNETQALLSNKTATEFSNIKQSLKGYYMKKPDTVYDQAQKIFDEIINEQYFFDKYKVYASMLDKIRMKDLSDFAEEIFGRKSRKVVLRFFIKDKTLKDNFKLGRRNNVHLINDIGDLKKFSNLFRIPRPQMNVTRIGI